MRQLIYVILLTLAAVSCSPAIYTRSIPGNIFLSSLDLFVNDRVDISKDKLKFHYNTFYSDYGRYYAVLKKVEDTIIVNVIQDEGVTISAIKYDGFMKYFDFQWLKNGLVIIVQIGENREIVVVNLESHGIKRYITRMHQIGKTDSLVYFGSTCMHDNFSDTKVSGNQVIALNSSGDIQIVNLSRVLSEWNLYEPPIDTSSKFLDSVIRRLDYWDETLAVIITEHYAGSCPVFHGYEMTEWLYRRKIYHGFQPGRVVIRSGEYYYTSANPENRGIYRLSNDTILPVIVLSKHKDLFEYYFDRITDFKVVGNYLILLARRSYTSIPNGHDVLIYDVVQNKFIDMPEVIIKE